MNTMTTEDYFRSNMNLNSEKNSRMPQESRQKLRPWLKRILDEDRMNGVKWINPDEGMFKILWPHKLKTNWKEENAEVFMEWARQTGRYNEGITPKDYTTWKTNLRCALTKCPDIEFIREEGAENDTPPCRIYRMKLTATADKKKSEMQRVTDSSPACSEEISQDNSYFDNVETMLSSNRPTFVKLMDEIDPVPVKTELCLDNVTTYDDGLGGIQMSLGSLNLTGVHYSDVVMNSDTNKLEDFGGLVGIGQSEMAPVPQSVAYIPTTVFNAPNIPTTVYHAPDIPITVFDQFAQVDASRATSQDDTKQLLLLMQQIDTSAIQTDSLAELNLDLNSADIPAVSNDAIFIDDLLELF